MVCWAKKAVLGRGGWCAPLGPAIPSGPSVLCIFATFAHTWPVVASRGDLSSRKGSMARVQKAIVESEVSPEDHSLPVNRIPNRFGDPEKGSEADFRIASEAFLHLCQRSLLLGMRNKDPASKDKVETD